jgi:hypothetical protein
MAREHRYGGSGSFPAKKKEQMLLAHPQNLNYLIIYTN